MKLSSQFSWDKDSYSVRCCDIVIIIVNNYFRCAENAEMYIIPHMHACAVHSIRK